ncbi:MAG: hypothetical protein AVDCRST_MAG18-1763 [uncultured Thermomicrobiales bacterium]|uniref:Uncharacterized protein n=1 Tax=uncultured Thermomicrobiales bacterium TaxID=1645740 RepID=A0A6J4V7F5_9BACT|nr:MAG: hypothetical protein AVDCRST_MAG18-1763 [uncultured Thermomicrobiales bacterium]
MRGRASPGPQGAGWEQHPVAERQGDVEDAAARRGLDLEVTVVRLDDLRAVRQPQPLRVPPVGVPRAVEGQEYPLPLSVRHPDPRSRTLMRASSPACRAATATSPPPGELPSHAS